MCVELPKYICGVDDVEACVGDRHARFNVYCVNSEALNVVFISLALACTTQMDDDTSTATHVDISKHRVWQSDSVVIMYHVPPGDITPSCRLHVTHSVKTHQCKVV